MTRPNISSHHLIKQVYKIYIYFTGNRLYLFIALTFVESILKSFGILMILPMLELTSGKAGGFLQKITQVSFIRQFSFVDNFASNLSLILVFLVFIFISSGCLQYYIGLVSNKISVDLRKKIQSDLIRGVSKANYLYLANKQCGDINNLILYETNSFVAGFQHFAEIISLTINIAVMMAFSFSLSWRLTFVAIIFSIPMILFFKRANKFLFKNSHGQTKNNGILNHFIFQFIFNLKYLKIIGKKSDRLIEIVEEKLDEQRNLMINHKKISLLNKVIVEPSTVLFICGIIFYMVALKGERLEQVLAAIYFLYRTTIKIFGYPNGIQKIISKMGAINSIEKLRMEIKQNKEQSEGIASVGQFKKEIKFKNISFSYGDQEILKNINLTIKKGQIIGIVGESGAGKTTLFDLLIGLLAPLSGEICIDDKSYSQFKSESLRRIFGYVTQDPVMFNDTIANNVSLWENNVDNLIRDEKIITALKLADCYEFISKTPKGIETIVGEKGMKLSGGQKQRIAIARELYRDPQIIIFDEATSSLDAFSEKFIQESIASVARSKTVVIISHRLSTLKDCNYIYLIEDKIIKEEGKWSDLISHKDSQFYKLCKTQEIPLTY